MEKYKETGIKVLSDSIIKVRKMILDNEQVQLQFKRQYNSIDNTIHSLRIKIRELKRAREIILKGDK